MIMSISPIKYATLHETLPEIRLCVSSYCASRYDLKGKTQGHAIIGHSQTSPLTSIENSNPGWRQDRQVTASQSDKKL